MRNCTKKPTTNFPTLNRGDTVLNRQTGRVYMKCESRSGPDLLVNLKTGEGLDADHHLFGSYESDCWVKVYYCFKEEC